jgi:hypothetical protein
MGGQEYDGANISPMAASSTAGAGLILGSAENLVER